MEAVQVLLVALVKMYFQTFGTLKDLLKLAKKNDKVKFASLYLMLLGSEIDSINTIVIHSIKIILILPTCVIIDILGRNPLNYVRHTIIIF